jgi:hypothetical protein
MNAALMPDGINRTTKCPLSDHMTMKMSEGKGMTETMPAIGFSWVSCAGFPTVAQCYAHLQPSRIAEHIGI